MPEYETVPLGEGHYMATGCPCGWRSVDTFASVASMRHIAHMAVCPAAKEVN